MYNTFHSKKIICTQMEWNSHFAEMVKPTSKTDI